MAGQVGHKVVFNLQGAIETVSFSKTTKARFGGVKFRLKGGISVRQ